MYCNNCGLAYTNPRPSIQEIERFYGRHYYGKDNARFKGIFELLVRLFRKQRTHRLLNLKKSGRILDIGCGRGQMLYEFKKRGWQTFGTELTESKAQAAREEFGLDVLTVPLEACGFEDNFFDVVTLWHVLEHLPYPRETLREINRVLKKDGFLVVAVPHFDSWEARIFKGKWFHLDVPRHYYHFSLQTLTQMLAITGFKVKSQHHFSIEYNPYGLMQSLLNQVSGQSNFLYNLLSADSDRSLSQSKSILLMNLLLVPPLAVSSLPLSYLAALFQTGGTIELLAGKQNG
ncbi:MAG: class I SAM-dependent methyltransferase [Anaerolineales bacterium]|nr:class I SAM-dependent methyltransferase [Anaerolineales bacterium]